MRPNTVIYMYVDDFTVQTQAPRPAGHRFPTFIGAATPVITGLLLIIAGIILAVMDKNDRKTFVSDTNKFAYDERR